jgi:NAD(P)H-hydrate epimerase
MRKIDRLTTEHHGIPSLVLMENAATATVRTVESLCSGCAGSRILVLCGKGNNGGDGAAAARLLATAGARVDVVLFASLEDTKGDARTNFERLQSWNDERGLREEREPADLGAINFFQCDSEKAWAQLLASVLGVPYDAVIDALFGTGLTRPVDGLQREAVAYLRRLHQTRDSTEPPHPLIISIDLPSGLNSDTNELIGETVCADATVTMTAPKPANVLPPAAKYNGELVVADIGSPVDLIDEADSQLFVTDEADARRWLIQTRYTPDSHKSTHGHVVIVAGSRGFTGAAALCANAGMCAGAGLVTVATPASVQPLVATQVMPEVMTTSLAETDRGTVSDEAIDYFLKFSERADVVAIGPGLSSEDERTRAFVAAVVEKRSTPVVIDADGLNCLSPWPAKLRGSQKFPIVLTPHPGEMLRLIGVSDKSALKDRVAAARDFATQHEVILLLKGTRSVIAAPDGRVFVNSSGNAGLGTAGAGDTLTGIIAGFLAQAYGTLRAEANALEAVIAALFVGGLAGDIAAREIGMRAMVASDIRDHLSAALCSLDPAGERP